ncbi:MAG: methyl-accepting chemotaxis protein [Candidatus Tectimicrobiota bacterium]
MLIWRSKKLGVKVAGGFTLVLLLTAGVAVIGVRGLATVDTRVTLSTATNHLAQHALKARAEEQEALRQGNTQTIDQTSHHIAALTQQAAATRDTVSDVTISQQLAAVQAAASEYAGGFTQALEVRAQQAQAEETMTQAARSLVAIAEEFREKQAQAGREVQDNTQAAIQANEANAEDVSRILQGIMHLRLAEETFRLRRTPAAQQQVETRSSAILGWARDLQERLHTSPTTASGAASADLEEGIVVDVQELAEQIMTHLETYEAVFTLYARQIAEQLQAEADMAEQAQRLEAHAATLLQGQQQQWQRVYETPEASPEARQSALTQAQDAAHLRQEVLAVRLAEQQFIQRPEAPQRQQMEARLRGLARVTSELLARLRALQTPGESDTARAEAGPDHHALAEQVLGTLQNYHQTFVLYAGLVEQARRAEADMARQAQRLLETAETIRVDQQQAARSAQQQAASRLAVAQAQMADTNQLLQGVLTARVQEKHFIQHGEAQASAAVQQLLAANRTLAQQLKASFPSREDRQRVDAMLAVQGAYETAFMEYVVLTRSGHAAAAHMQQAASTAVTRADDSREHVTTQMRAELTQARHWMSAGASVAMVLGLLLACCLTRSIVRPLRAAVARAHQLAAGDLTGRMEVAAPDETGQLLRAMQTTSVRLAQVVREIRDGATTLSTVAGEITQGNANLSQRTQEQRAALEATAASMEEMTGAVQHNARNAQQAQQLAVGARERAAQGGEVVQQAMSAMVGITSSSQQISDIIGVIDSLAFQTNLLALNAAIEAARAGEQGRGFAVVAAEVRKLAQRSAEAARDIKTLIVDSAEKVSDGARLVNASGQTLEEIVTAVTQVSDIVAEIAAASQEQASGIAQVNQAMLQIDTVTQHNAALVDDAAATSAVLNRQAQALQQLMEFFTLEAPALAPASGVVQRTPQPPVPTTPARVRKARAAGVKTSPLALHG